MKRTADDDREVEEATGFGDEDIEEDAEEYRLINDKGLCEGHIDAIDTEKTR